MTLRLTFPVKSHKTEDLRGIYNEYKRVNSGRFREWWLIENDIESFGPDSLKDIQYEIYEFLKSRLEWDSHAALAAAFADFRRLISTDKVD